jgi:hypothetical protein
LHAPIPQLASRLFSLTAFVIVGGLLLVASRVPTLLDR